MNTLVVISGLPCSGKSTLAEGLAKKLNYPVFSVDPIESAVLKSGISKGFETGLAAYLVVETIAAEHLKLGFSVIIDAVSPVQEARDMWRGLSSRYGVKLVIIECVLNEEIHREWVESRVRNIYGIPEVTWEDVEKQRQEYLPWKEERLVVDTCQDLETYLFKSLEYIKS